MFIETYYGYYVNSSFIKEIYIQYRETNCNAKYGLMALISDNKGDYTVCLAEGTEEECEKAMEKLVEQLNCKDKVI